MHVAWAVSSEAIISAIIAILTGWAMDRFQPRYVASASLVAFILVFIVTINVGDPKRPDMPVIDVTPVSAR